MKRDLYWQNFGGKHLYIRPDFSVFNNLIHHLKQSDREALKFSLRTRDLTRIPWRQVGFQQEKHLEDYVLSLIAKNNIIHRQMLFETNGPPEPDSQPDLILELEKAIIIIELKLNAVSKIADVAQLQRYVDNRSLRQRFKGKKIHPVLLGGYFSPEVLAETKRDYPFFELISYDYENGDVLFNPETANAVFLPYLTR